MFISHLDCFLCRCFFLLVFLMILYVLYIYFGNKSLVGYIFGLMKIYMRYTYIHDIYIWIDIYIYIYIYTYLNRAMKS